MASVENLMGVGVDAETAKRTGFFLRTVTSSDSSINGPGNFAVRVSCESLNLGTGFAPGDTVLVLPVTAATLAAAGCGFNVAAVSVANLTAGYPKLLMKMSATNWLLLAGLTAAG